MESVEIQINEAPKEDVEKLHDAAEELLAVCAEQELDVPQYLKDIIEGNDSNQRDSIISPEHILRQQSLLIQNDDSEPIKNAKNFLQRVKADLFPKEVRVKYGSYTVTDYVDPADGDSNDIESDKRGKPKIESVKTASPIYKLFKIIATCIKTKSCDVRKLPVVKPVLEDVNLVLESDKLYLVLGAPGSGKSSLLKMIAGILPSDKDHVIGGTVACNGITQERGLYWSNLVSYVDQIDRLHARLTVKETFEFAWRCRSGGTHQRPIYSQDEDAKKAIEEADAKLIMVENVTEGLGLYRVKNTFVGDQQSVRGVSGGERKRVTVGEMMLAAAPVLCADEISTGLDAATTYDIIKLMKTAGKMIRSVRIISLLQPPPEVVRLFDKVILLSEGQVIYCGPVDEIISYFDSLGYEIPPRTDVADWLQTLATPDGSRYLKNSKANHLSPQEFKAKFDESSFGSAIRSTLATQVNDPNEKFMKQMASQIYRSSTLQFLKLLVGRELTLWWRDKTAIKAKIGQNFIMGVVAGTVFWQASSDPASVMGILFQSVMFVSVGAMLAVPKQFGVRGILYKHQDANFFPTWTYVLGRALARIPESLIDSVIYGSFIYWFVGLAYDNGASILNYIVFILLLFCHSFSGGLIFSIFSAILKDAVTAQACSAVVLIMLVLFSGFTVQPDVIPVYWIWIYWINIFAWTLRSLTINEFESGKYDTETPSGLTLGEVILTRFGFTINGEPYSYEWVWYGLAFVFGFGLLTNVASSIFLNVVRYRSNKSSQEEKNDENNETDAETEPQEEVEIPFCKVDLTFREISYTVKASTSDEKLELLKGVDGIVEAGKMTALMGSSGAGKTTLMDVLSLRKTSGEIKGEICLNGHPQEPISFRRCTGYVEQFDVQSPQLTIRETVEFSAKLRLDETESAVNQESIARFVDETLKTLELTSIQNLQVGDDATGGLSFERKKRLSIAVELVSNPSILFLDEPTSGLDARAAAIVMRSLKRIALKGRAVCATIHQPSIAIFNSFDSLLLLKRGGEVVFFGDLGHESCNLIDYFSRYVHTPNIRHGENPATWMLTTIGGGTVSSNRRPFDYAGSYFVSKLRHKCIEKIDDICYKQDKNEKVAFPSKYATKRSTQMRAVIARMMKIYWRSPSYNLVRVMIAAVVALLFSSVYASQRTPKTESDMNSRVTTIFVAVVFLAVTSLNTVLGVFERERNMYYRHKEALMYDQVSMLVSCSVSELPFILTSSMVFVVIFYFVMGFALDAVKFFLFYLFVTLTLALFTFLGQMYMSLTPDSTIAQGIGGLTVVLNVLFTGVLIRPHKIGTFWKFAYWVFPGHYLYEGLIMSQYADDKTEIEATFGTPFFTYLNCTQNPFIMMRKDYKCTGSAEDWVITSFVEFSQEHIPWNILYMFGAIFLVRMIALLALAKLNFRNT